MLLKLAVRKFIFIPIIAFLWLCFGATAVHASVLTKTYDRTYTMVGDHVHATETITTTVSDPNFYIPADSKEVFTVFDPIINDTNAAAKIQQTMPTIAVVDGAGATQQFTTQVNGQDINVYVPRTRNITYTNPLTLSVSYDSYSLSSRNGALYDLYIPSFSKDFQFSDSTTDRTFNTTVLIPKNLGELSLVVPDKQAQDSGDNWKLSFSQQDLTGTVSWIQIGTTQYYQFEIKQPYPASTNVPVFYNTFSVLLPRNVDAGPVTQSVLFTGITPTPDSVTTDENGNLVANFIVPANRDGEIDIKGYVTTKHNLQVDIKDSGNISDISPAIIAANTQPAQYWEVDASQIQDAAKQLKGDSTNVYDLVSKTYQFVVSKINYDEVKRFGLNQRQGALATLLKGSGVCMEYSDLFIALMRAEGVPARGAFGYGYDSRSTNGEDAAHQWAEVYDPKLNAWIAVDTTWGESGPAVIGGDLNHFYKYVASVDPNTPSPVEVSYLGSLGPIKDENFQINALASIPDTSGVTEANLLSTYPAKTDLQLRFESFTKGISLGVTTVNAKYASILTSGGMSESLANVIIAATYILVVVLIGGGIFLIARKRRKTKLAAYAAKP